MINTISKLDSVIASLTETFADVDLKQLKVTFMKNLIKYQITKNSEKGLGITINGVYFTHEMRYDFEEKSINVIYDVKCVGIINYTDIRSWS